MKRSNPHRLTVQPGLFGSVPAPQTRLDLKQPTAKGLLILVNDGNHALAPEMTAHLMMPILNSGSYSAIHTVLYMSVKSVTVNHPFGDARFWMPWSIRDKPSVSLAFLT